MKSDGSHKLHVTDGSSKSGAFSVNSAGIE